MRGYGCQCWRLTYQFFGYRGHPDYSGMEHLKIACLPHRPPCPMCPSGAVGNHCLDNTSVAVSSAEGPLAARELGKGCPACPALERAVCHRDGREETLLLLGEQACDTYAPTPLCVPQEKGVLWRASSPTTAPGMDVWSARPNDGIPSNRFPTATPVGAARSAARYCGSYRGSLARSLGREQPRGQSDRLDESGR
jgi:hypothetical protein